MGLHWNKLKEFLQTPDEWSKEGKTFCIATLASSRGSVPQNLGAKMAVADDGVIRGTIGGGKLEAAVLQRIKTLLLDSQSPPIQIWEWNLQKDLGMTCGGEVTVICELYQKKAFLPIAVFGAGHVAQALIPLLLTLDVEVFWFDDREEWLNKKSSGISAYQESRLHRQLWTTKELLQEQIRRLPEGCFIVSVTKGHADDFDVLRFCLERTDFPYAGAIGSETKGKVLRQKLIDAGFAKEKVEQVYCPIGAPFGSNEPAEIALSIAAQILSIRDNL